jgi:hypothetical protein
MRIKAIQFFLTTFFCVSCHAQSDDLCVASPKGICRLPVDAVFFARDRLLGKKIGVQGIASVEDDGVYFYPDLESRKYLVRERAVRVIGGGGHLKDIEFLDGKRINFVGVLGKGDGDFWATITLVNDPLEEPLPIKNYSPAPPPPKSLSN